MVAKSNQKPTELVIGGDYPERKQNFIEKLFVKQEPLPRPVNLKEHIPMNRLVKLPDRENIVESSVRASVKRLIKNHSLKNAPFCNSVWPKGVDTVPWVTDEGKFTKRIAKEYAKRNVKLSQDFLTEVGNIVNKARTTNADFAWDFTDDFGWTSGDFGDAGSCLFHDNELMFRDTRYRMLFNGGFAMRAWKPMAREENVFSGAGRCWVMPYENDFLLFNGYGLDLRKFAHTMKNLLGCQKAIPLKGWSINDTERKWGLYVNNRLYRVSDNPDASSKIESDHLRTPDSGDCDKCGRHINGRNGYIVNARPYCDSCRKTVTARSIPPRY